MSAIRYNQIMGIGFSLVGLAWAAQAIREFTRTTLPEAETLWKGVSIVLAVCVYWLVLVTAWTFERDHPKKLISIGLLVIYSAVWLLLNFLPYPENDIQMSRLYSFAMKATSSGGFLGLGTLWLLRGKKHA